MLLKYAFYLLIPMSLKFYQPVNAHENIIAAATALVRERYNASESAERKIMKIALDQPSKELELLVNLELYDQMKKANHIIHTTVIKMAGRVKKLMEFTNYQTFPSELRAKATDLFNKLQKNVYDDIPVWAQLLQGGNYQDIVEIEDEIDGFSRIDFVEGLVQEAYNNSESTESVIINFAKDLSKIESELSVYLELYNQMERANHSTPSTTLKMAGRVKNLMEMTNYPAVTLIIQEKTSNLMKKLLQDMKDDIPIWAQQVRSGNHRTIVEAERLANGLKKVDFLQPLVQEAYKANEKAESVIIKFGFDLPKLESELLVHLELYNQMERAHHITPATVLKMAGRVKKLTEMTQYPTVTSETKVKTSDLLAKLLQQLKKDIPGWSKQVKNEQFYKLVEMEREKYDFHGIDFFGALVREIYNASDSDEKTLIKLAIELPHIESELLIHLELYNQMKKLNHIKPLTVLKIIGRVKKMMEMKNYPNVSLTTRAKSSDLLEELQHHVNNYVPVWAELFKSGNYKEIIEIDKLIDGFKRIDFVEPLVREVYNVSESAESQIIKFATDLSQIESELLVHLELYNQMERANHITPVTVLKMTGRVKKLIEMTNYPNVTPKTKAKTSDLLTKLQLFSEE